jgi:hypothetical protein
MTIVIMHIIKLIIALFHRIVITTIVSNQRLYNYMGVCCFLFNERLMRSTLYYTITLSCILSVLAHRNNCPPHTDTLSSFRASQSLLFIFNGTCSLRSNTHPYNYIIFGLTRSWWLRYDEIEQLSVWWYAL